jgi:hypothetical protein
MAIRVYAGLNRVAGKPRGGPAPGLTRQYCNKNLGIFAKMLLPGRLAPHRYDQFCAFQLTLGLNSISKSGGMQVAKKQGTRWPARAIRPQGPGSAQRDA